MRRLTVCSHVREVAWREYECSLTGVSVDRLCGSATPDACLPRKALMLVVGTLRVGDLHREERREVERMVKEIGTQTPGFDARGLSLDQLENALRVIRLERIRRRRATRALPRLRARLQEMVARRSGIEEGIAALQGRIRAAEEGTLPDDAAQPTKRGLTQAQLEAMRRNAARARAAKSASRGRR